MLTSCQHLTLMRADISFLRDNGTSLILYTVYPVWCHIILMPQCLYVFSGSLEVWEPFHLSVWCFGWVQWGQYTMGMDGSQWGSWLISSSIHPLFRSHLSHSADLALATFLIVTGEIIILVLDASWLLISSSNSQDYLGGARPGHDLTSFYKAGTQTCKYFKLCQKMYQICFIITKWK